MNAGKDALGYEAYKEAVGTGVPDDVLVARVAAEHKTRYVLFGDDGELDAEVRGKFHQGTQYPKVGDWVSYELVAEGKAAITDILPRRTVVARKESDGDDAQVIAANVDILCIVQGLDSDFNPRRLERYLVLANQSGCVPFIILTKADITEDAEGKAKEARDVAPGVQVVVVSALTGQGMDEVKATLVRGKTAVLLGSSGAGKSTLVNYLLGSERQRTGAVREDDERGRHTTTHRELFLLENGAILIDTPGMRELGLLSAEDEAFDDVFERIAALALTCRYTDCDHEKSAGCAIRAAIADGSLDEKAFESYKKLSRERKLKESREDAALLAEHKQGQKKLQKGYRSTQAQKYSDRGFR